MAFYNQSYLEHDSAFENDQHEKSEQAVVPIFVQTPESDTEDLEDKERRGSMFPKECGERRNWNIEFIFPVKIEQGLDDVACKSLRGGEFRQRRVAC